MDWALRLVSAGTSKAVLTSCSPVFTTRLLAATSSLTETFRLRLIRPESSTTGRNFTPTPNSLNSMVMPSSSDTGMGNSPPEMNSACCPVKVVRVGSASTLAVPLSLAASSTTLKRKLSEMN
ncbi:hypothetical protein D3C85_1535890 [compost metagenome]